MRPALPLLGALLLALLALPGPGRAQSAPAAADPLPAPQLAALRLVNLSPDAPRIDLRIGDATPVKDLPFGDASGYVVVPAGEQTLRVYPHRPPRGSAGNEAETVPSLEPITAVVVLEPGAYHSVALVGFYEPPPDNANTGNLSVNVTPDDALLTIQGPRGFELEVQGDVLLGDEASERLEAGDYTVTARAPGYRAGRSRVQVQPLETAVVSISLQQGEGELQEQAQPIASNADGGWHAAELQLFRETAPGLPPAGHAYLRAVNVSPLAPPLDLVVRRGDESGGAPAGAPPGVEQGEQELTRALVFPNAADYRPVRAGTVAFAVRVADSESLVTEVADLTLEPGSLITLFLVSDPADNRLRVVPVLSAITVNAP